MTKKNKFTLPEDTGLKSMHEIESQADRVIAAKASFFSGPGSSRKIQLSKIHIDPNQPRKSINQQKFEELKNSMASDDGLIEPIIIRPISDNDYMIVCGERRYRSAKDLGWEEIEAVIKNIDEKKAFELAMIENLQREDLSPIEVAEGFKHMIDAGIVKNQSELAERLGLTRQAVSNKMALNLLPKSIRNILSTHVDKISEFHVRSFGKLKNEDQMLTIANMVIEEGLTGRQTEELVAGVVNGTINLADKTKSSQLQIALPRTRTITNPSRPIIVDENKSIGLWVKHDGQSFVIKAKGAVRNEEHPEVKEALYKLHSALFNK